MMSLCATMHGAAALSLCLLAGCGSGYSLPAQTSDAAAASAIPAAQTPDPAACSQYTWARGAKTFFANRCYSCHASAGANFDANSQSSVSGGFASILQNVRNGRMPPGGPAIDAATQTQLAAWQGCNFP